MRKEYFWKTTCALLATMIAAPAGAEYNANISGIVNMVSSYTEGDYIYFRIENQPSSNGQCSAAYFVITEVVPQNRRNQAFAQLLASKLSREPINIGYDSVGDCAHGFIRVHRVG